MPPLPETPPPQDDHATSEGPKKPKRGIHRRLYDWVLHWAETPYGGPALGVLSFAESSFFPIPPDVLLIPLVLARRKQWIRLALICTIASVLGALLGYAIGHYFWTEVEWIRELFFSIPGFTPERFEHVGKLFDEWGFWIVFTAGFTPIPYKLFTVSGGLFAINLPMFVLASVLSRGGRFSLVALLVNRFGEKAQDLIEKRFNLFATLFVILLVGGFLLVKWVI